MSENIKKLTSIGQSLWYDNIERRLLENGELQAMIVNGDIRGVTSNPSIFKNAIANSGDYDTALATMAWSGRQSEPIFWQLAVEDIRQACDLFRPLYDQTDGADGFVSLEVSPKLAHDTDYTVTQARQLWERVQRPNLMIKIPATPEGIPAIRRSIAAGVNVNVTLIFSLERYAQVIEAYLSGLEDRLGAGGRLEGIASVASFFISRVDSKVDGRLPEGSPLRGKAAIANARLAYEAFRSTFTGSRWKSLQERGASLQRPLWASTSTKNPAYPDTLYVDQLIGPDTVNTVPPQTLEAFSAHGQVAETLSQGLDQARDDLEQLEAQGVSMARVTQELEDEGVRSFSEAFSALLGTIEERRRAAQAQLGPLADPVSKQVAQLEASSFSQRMWECDPSLWTEDPAGQNEIRMRLGWLNLPESSRTLLPELVSFAANIRREGIRRVLLLGMGGSSLAPEVLSNVFASVPSTDSDEALCLAILDSTDPAQVMHAAHDFPPDQSLYIVSSKSGETTEVLAMLEYFWDLSGGDRERFVAVTDPGSSLESLAKARRFRDIFLADPQVGGRYSALTVFGLLPAALLGIDLDRLLARGAWLRAQCVVQIPSARNPGLVLGAALGAAVQHGRDKLTILADAPLVSFGSWLEQLIAESSGKQGKGLIPVDREPLEAATRYTGDRLFVYLRQNGEYDDQTAALRAEGHPVLGISVAGAYELGAEFYRWEIATATACHIWRVNAFDQPDVEDAKARARTKVAEYQQSGQLKMDQALRLDQAGPALHDFLKGVRQGDYIALNAFLPRQQPTINNLQILRIALKERSGCATTLGFGPRYLHSTGQLHKGGPDNGLFLLVTADATEDIEIPSQGLTFSTLEQAQALGDFEALKGRGRRILHVHLSHPEDIYKLADLI